MWYSTWTPELPTVYLTATICHRPERSQAGIGVHRWAHNIVPVNFRGMSDFRVRMGTPKPEDENAITHIDFAKRPEWNGLSAQYLCFSYRKIKSIFNYLSSSLSVSLPTPISQAGPPFFLFSSIHLFNCYFLIPLYDGHCSRPIKWWANQSPCPYKAYRVVRKTHFFRWIVSRQRTEDLTSWSNS